MKITLAICTVLFAVVFCEPPVPSNRYLPGNQGGQPSQSYGVPSGPSQNYGAPSGPSQNYGAPSGGGNNGYSGAPSSSYGAPAITGAVIRPNTAYGAPNNGGGGGGGGYGHGGNGGSGYDDQSEPANYQFEYMVKDEPSGNDFGHQESRQGDQTYGRYYVVLPDGRKQIVEYEADANGYRPKISYEEGYPVNNGNNGGYGRGPAGHSGGDYAQNGGNGGYAHGGGNGGGYQQQGGNGGGYAQNGGYNY